MFLANMRRLVQQRAAEEGISIKSQALAFDMSYENSPPQLALEANVYSQKMFIDDMNDENNPLQLAIEAHVYSRKVFIGGLPPDIDEDALIQVFSPLGPIKIDWPHKDENSKRFPPQGYAFLAFERESSVHQLLEHLKKNHGKYYLQLSTLSHPRKLVQVRPWLLADSEYYGDRKYANDQHHQYTVFVGGIPRPTTARDLWALMNKVFGSVGFVQIDLDNEYNYPKGAARVRFTNRHAFAAAIAERYVKIRTCDSEKQMEMKPFLVECSLCEVCESSSTRQFCANIQCLKYICPNCWAFEHDQLPSGFMHQVLVKNPVERQRRRLASRQW